MAPAVGAALEDPAARARDHADRCAAVPRLGLCPHAPGRRAVLDAGPAAAASTPRETLRDDRASTGAEALVVVPVMLQRILELGRRALAALRHLVAAVIAVSGSALPGALATALHGRVRRRALQPLRLDRGRLGDDRDARRICAPPPAPPVARPAARWSACSTTTATSCRPGRTVASSSANELLFDGYTGGGDKARIGEPDGHRRHRPFRRRRPPVRRRPRRRHDRLRRREHLPPRGRRPAGRQRRASTRSAVDRRSRRRVRSAAERLRGPAARGASSTTTTLKALVRTPPRPLQGARATSCSSTSCRATRPGKVLKREL